jgi:two-component system, cell cycle sensor histidine kinase and response regulator CckA
VNAQPNVSGDPLRILLVTSDDIVATDVNAALAPIAGGVLQVSELPKALVALAQHEFHAVLFDLEATDLSATHVVKQLRQQVPTTAVVVLCTNETETEARGVLNDGAQDYITRAELNVLARTVLHAVERQICENALRASEHRYQTIIEASSEGILIHVDGIIRLVNPALAQLFDFHNSDDLIGKPIWPFVHRDDRLRVRSYLQARTDGMPSPSRYEIRLVRGGAATIWVECLAKAIEWEGEAATLVTLIDITERKDAERSLQAAQEQLMQSQKLEVIGRLASGVAHDFNNLLTAILGFATLVIDDLGPEHPSTADVEQIRNSAQIGQGLTSQLLGLSRGRIIETETLDINKKVRRIEPLLRHLVDEDVALDIRPTPNAGCVRLDRGQLDQIILNLVLNARDAMPKGGRIVIETAKVLAHDDVFVTLSIADTGSGMDAATKRRIFEPFFTTKEFGKGTGLGLSTVNTIVQQNGGWISVQTQPGHGSTFTVFLPAADEPAPEVSGSTVSRSNDEIVLLVESQPQVRSVMCAMLRRHGFQVLEAGRGTDAIEIARNHPTGIDVAVIDLALPDMHGAIVAERLNANDPDIRILISATAAHSQWPSQAPGEAKWTFLAKPFTADTLIQKLQQVLR